MTPQKLKILVTGGRGQLGHKIGQYFKEHSDGILITSTDYDVMDVTEEHKVDAFLAAKVVKPDIIIHAAAYTKVDQAEDESELCRRINVLGTENIAKAANKIGATLIYISTDYVFDGQKTLPYTEEDQPNPLSVYGQTKYEGELAVQKYCPKHYIIRVAWLFGELPPNHPGTNFVETMLRLSKEKSELKIVNDQIGSPTYTGDLVETIGKIVKSEIRNPNFPFGTYHFSGTGECFWYDFAKEIFKQAKINIKVEPITSGQYPQKAKRPAYSYLDKGKIEAALQIRVRPWQMMLKDYLDRKRG